AVIADKIDSQILDVSEGAPIIFMKNITYTTENIIMDYFQSRFRADKGKIKVEVFSPGLSDFSYPITKKSTD
ncbi:MAG: UTRA domain-containing protein, partial [Atribacterota bacterium]